MPQEREKRLPTRKMRYKKGKYETNVYVELPNTGTLVK
jgi:hypothetical protein